MRVRFDTSEIAALRLAVEKKFGSPVRTPRHFTALSFQIEDIAREYLSDTTLQRLWQYKTGYSTVAIHTLNVLCHYLGISDWETFCTQLKESSDAESEMKPVDGIDIDSLKAGTRIFIGWLPNRTCIIKYLGNHRFETIEAHNSKLQVGDTFTCINIQKGRELYLDKVQRGESEMYYVIGTRNGLTTLKTLAD